MRYDVYENRALFLALFRHTNFVASRGQFRLKSLESYQSKVYLIEFL